MTLTIPIPETAALATQLPRLSPPQARFRRLAMDRRFERWLRQLSGMDELTILPAVVSPDLGLAVHTQHGALQVALDSRGWPALRMAASLSDPQIAQAVLGHLLSPWLAQLAAVFGPLRISPVTPEPGYNADAITIAGPGLDLVLAHCDDAVVAQFQRILADVCLPDMTPWQGLRLRPRLRVMRRSLPACLINSLVPGDVLLTDTQACRLVAGLGPCVQASIQLDLQERVLNLTDDPTMTSGPDWPTDPGEAPAGGLGQLHLPVSFELDTARISLGELAALRAGSTIELDAPVQDCVVRLVCHGQTLGHGQLVAIGDQLGVLIRRMEPVHDTPADQ